MENEEVKYKVLARKYRSSNFDELIGQDVLVKTLTNAINTNRLAHAYIFTGIRGVGKTSTARIFAKSLNCLGADGKATGAVGICSQKEIRLYFFAEIETIFKSLSDFRIRIWTCCKITVRHFLFRNNRYILYADFFKNMSYRLVARTV